MPHWLIHGAVIAGTWIARIIAGLAFWMGCFAKKDERKGFQSRIDDFWRLVERRNRTVGNTTVALFNRIGYATTSGFDHLFGKQLVSIESVGVSVYFSAAITYLFALIFVSWLHAFNRQAYDAMQANDVIFTYICSCLLSFVGAFTLHRLPRPWRIISASMSIVALFLPALMNLRSYLKDDSLGHMITISVLEATPIALVVSLLSDYAALIIMRKLFKAMIASISVFRIISVMLLLVGMAVLFSVVPQLYGMYLHSQIDFSAPNPSALRNEHIAYGIAGLNFSTSLLCLVPAIMLIVVLLHRIIWPFLSRITTPLSENKLCTKPAAWFAFGSFMMLVATHPKSISLQDVLKLFS